MSTMSKKLGKFRKKEVVCLTLFLQHFQLTHKALGVLVLPPQLPSRLLVYPCPHQCTIILCPTTSVFFPLDDNKDWWLRQIANMSARKCVTPLRLHTALTIPMSWSRPLMKVTNEGSDSEQVIGKTGLSVPRESHEVSVTGKVLFCSFGIYLLDLSAHT